MGVISAAKSLIESRRAAKAAEEAAKLKAVGQMRSTLNAASKMSSATAEGRQMIGAGKRAMNKGVDPRNTQVDFARNYIPPKPKAGATFYDDVMESTRNNIKDRGGDPYNSYLGAYPKNPSKINMKANWMEPMPPIAKSPKPAPDKYAPVQRWGIAPMSIENWGKSRDPYNTANFVGSGREKRAYAEELARSKKKK